MKSTRPGAQGRGRPLLACVVALVIALGIIIPGTANAQGGAPMSGSARYVDDSPMNSSGGPSMNDGGGSPMYSGGESSMYSGGDSSMYHGGEYYYVRPGDTLSSIAMRFGTTTEALMRANGIQNPNQIYVGQQLVIPGGNSGGTGGKMCQHEHVVRYGETLSGIALRYMVDPYELMRANGISNPNQIYAGQVLCIPTDQGYMPMPPMEPMPPKYPPMEPMPPQQPPMEPMPPKYPPMEPMPPQQPPMEPMPPKYPPMEPMPPQQPPMEPMPCQPMPYDGPQAYAIELDPCQPMPPMEPMPPMQPCGPDCGPGGGQPGSGGPGKGMDFWRGSYYADKYFGEFVEEREDAEIRFNWYTRAPFEGMPEDRFSVRWERAVWFDGGEYRFHATSDDGVRIYVDGNTVIDAWNIQPATEFTGDVSLSKGVHWVVVEYYEEAEDAQISVYWEYKPKFQMPHR